MDSERSRSPKKKLSIQEPRPVIHTGLSVNWRARSSVARIIATAPSLGG